MANTQTQNETATQLFARLVNSEKIASTSSTSHSSSTNPNIPEYTQKTPTDKRLVQLENDLMLNKNLSLDHKIFTKEFSNKDVIEIYGKFNTGKSELIMHLIARYLMPCQWKINNNLTIDLSEYSSSTTYKEPIQMSKAILINTDAKFNILRLYTIMEERVKLILKKWKNLPNDILRLIQKFIRDCLKNLVFYNCLTNEHFIYSLVACEHFIQTLLANPSEPKSILPIFIDSINSNFEIPDKFNGQLGFCENDHTENYCVQLAKKLIDNYNVCLITSRVDLTSSNMKSLNLNENYSSNSYKKWQAIVNKRVELVMKMIDNETEKVDDLKVFYYFRVCELIRKKEENSNEIKSETNMLKIFSRFSIKNSGFALID